MEQKIYKQYKSRIKSIDETKGVVVVAANAFNNIDAQNDISVPGSFSKTIENIKNIYWYKNHDTNETLGVITRLWEDDLFLNAEMKFNLDKEISKNMYSDYRFFQEHANEIKHSVGVSAIPDKVEFRDDIRLVKEWKLWEVSSLTKWPANELAGTHAVKTIEDMENIQMYFDWMSSKGLHTDEFIRQTENLLETLKEKTFKPKGILINPEDIDKELQLQIIEPPVKALEIKKEPDFSTLIKSINDLKL